MLILEIQKGNPPGEPPNYHAGTCHWLFGKFSKNMRHQILYIHLTEIQNCVLQM